MIHAARLIFRHFSSYRQSTMNDKPRAGVERRQFLKLAGSAATLVLPAASATAGAPSDGRSLGDGRRAYGERSPFETSARTFRVTNTPGTGSSRTPLQDSYGIITPSSLHFERHHAGVPKIDPKTHELLIHGLVDRPAAYTLSNLRRLPSVSRIHFIECAGNSHREQEGRPGEDPQKSHGLVSCSEWTGVPLSVLLKEVGVQRGARWIVAEGADACRMARSIPLEKAIDDVLVAFGQNGEALRPEQGYPLRLVVPGWEGNINIKWLHRLHVLNEPAMTREEAATYTDLAMNGTARQFSFVMEPKSVITRPAGGQKIDGAGWHQVEGLAWSGRGKIARVEISLDDGRTWRDAQLQTPIFSKAFTRFSLDWRWNGKETTIRSRCSDESGAIQPTREAFIAQYGMRAGPDGYNHYNGIKIWRVGADGSVTHV
jgi:sulfane dehydrogenase subunit SoxC